jgi:hypothetical protein
MEPPERVSARMMEARRSILNPASSFGLHFCCFKRLLVCNKINDGSVFHVDHQKINCFKSLLVHYKANDDIVFPMDHKKCFKSLPIRNKANDDIVFPMNHQKKYLKNLRFKTKLIAILSFLWATRKLVKIEKEPSRLSNTCICCKCQTCSKRYLVFNKNPSRRPAPGNLSKSEWNHLSEPPLG